MANSDRDNVCSFGTVKLKFTSGKVVTLQNVYRVPSIPKCLISVSKLDEHGFKITFESRKVVISKHGVFVGKGYILGGIYHEAFDSFKVYKAEVENQLGKKIKILRSDRGGEYFTRMFDAFCEDNGIRSVFVGYDKNSKAYRLLDERTVVIIDSRDVDQFSNDVENSHAELVPTSCGSSYGETSTEINEPRRSIRARKEKDFGSDFFSYLVKGTQKKVTREVIFTINIDDNHKTFFKAMSSRDAPMWKEAMSSRDLGISKTSQRPRLVAKGYKQKEGIGYFDMYAPVARISSIINLIAIYTVKGLYIHQMDVKTNEEVYMEQPEGFVIQGQENKHNSADRCIYTRSTKDYTVVICLYVDDMLIIGTTLDGILETKSYLSSNFKMKDLGEFRHLEIKECNTPFDTSVKLEVNSGRAVAQLEYASVIGSLMYAMHCTRPDIAFACSFKLTYTSYPGVLEGYSDASWINHSGDSKSTSGWIYTLAGGAVSWASKKQTCISHSTMEAEFIALAAAGKEAEWIRDLLMDIRLWPGPMPSIPMYCDSKAALSIAYNSVYNGKSRHLRL
ncbi:retrovirus-related pol polyprotein from transposon TNT 1-94 [Tanacetum coccineum]